MNDRVRLLEKLTGKPYNCYACTHYVGGANNWCKKWRGWYCVPTKERITISDIKNHDYWAVCKDWR